MNRVQIVPARLKKVGSADSNQDNQAVMHSWWIVDDHLPGCQLPKSLCYILYRCVFLTGLSMMNVSYVSEKCWEINGLIMGFDGTFHHQIVPVSYVSESEFNLTKSPRLLKCCFFCEPQYLHLLRCLPRSCSFGSLKESVRSHRIGEAGGGFLSGCWGLPSGELT